MLLMFWELYDCLSWKTAGSGRGLAVSTLCNGFIVFVTIVIICEQFSCICVNCSAIFVNKKYFYLHLESSEEGTVWPKKQIFGPIYFCIMMNSLLFYFFSSWLVVCLFCFPCFQVFLLTMFILITLFSTIISISLCVNRGLCFSQS